MQEKCGTDATHLSFNNAFSTSADQVNSIVMCPVRTEPTASRSHRIAFLPCRAGFGACEHRRSNSASRQPMSRHQQHRAASGQCWCTQQLPLPPRCRSCSPARTRSAQHCSGASGMLHGCRSLLAVGRASRACGTIWWTRVRVIARPRACAPGAPWRRAVAKVVTRRARSAIAICRIRPRYRTAASHLLRHR